MPDVLQNQGVEAILDELVQQFADPLACFRELVQNAIDAGSGQVEIDFEFQPPGEGRLGGTKERGMAVAEVRDFGEGMTRELIEDRLIQLFSSGKDEDYTKIGRFGIGFVSVFALEPAAVCVDTGRTGEYWRVLFGPDCNYELFALDRPMEGTRVRIFLPMDAGDFESFRVDARETIKEWCKHAEIPILVEGDDIREPFEVDGACQVSYREEGTRIVAALTQRKTPPYGYYNRGLTLKEGRRGPHEYVAYKIDSRYLEHTLTRDQIVEDKNYRKARDLLEELVEEDLPRRLLEQLEEAAGQRRPGGWEAPDSQHNALCWLLYRYSRAYDPPRGLAHRAIVPRFGGAPVTLEDCVEAANEGRLYRAFEATPLTRWFGDSALIVRDRSGHNGLKRLLSWHLDEAPPVIDRQWVMPRPVEIDELPGAAALADELEGLLAEVERRPVWVGLGRFGAASPLEDRPLVALEDRREPTALEDVPGTFEWWESTSGAWELVLNAAHPSVEKLARIARREPAWAAYMVVTLTQRAAEGRREASEAGQEATGRPASRAELRRAAVRRAGEGE